MNHFKVCGSVTFSTLTACCSQHSFSAFSSSRRKAVSPPFPCPAPGNHEPTFRLYKFTYSGHFIEMEAHAVWSLRLALFAYDDDEDGKAMSEMAEMGPFWRAGLWAPTLHFE